MNILTSALDFGIYWTTNHSLPLFKRAIYYCISKIRPKTPTALATINTQKNIKEYEISIATVTLPQEIFRKILDDIDLNEYHGHGRFAWFTSDYKRLLVIGVVCKAWNCALQQYSPPEALEININNSLVHKSSWAMVKNTSSDINLSINVLFGQNELLKFLKIQNDKQCLFSQIKTLKIASEFGGKNQKNLELIKTQVLKLDQLPNLTSINVEIDQTFSSDFSRHLKLQSFRGFNINLALLKVPYSLISFSYSGITEDIFNKDAILDLSHTRLQFFHGQNLVNPLRLPECLYTFECQSIAIPLDLSKINLNSFLSYSGRKLFITKEDNQDSSIDDPTKPDLLILPTCLKILRLFNVGICNLNLSSLVNLEELTLENIDAEAIITFPENFPNLVKLQFEKDPAKIRNTAIHDQLCAFQARIEQKNKLENP